MYIAFTAIIQRVILGHLKLFDILDDAFYDFDPLLNSTSNLYVTNADGFEDAFDVTIYDDTEMLVSRTDTISYYWELDGEIEIDNIWILRGELPELSELIFDEFVSNASFFS